ncbi:MAG TPA: ferritin-like domain-containing protein [Terracidiphilus sp.]|nr:ferritin-like domain-containing protein [Terracidiphilus sp.]
MNVNTIEKLFVDELKDLYSAETQITKALPKLAKAASSSELKSAFESHLKETQGHVERLEKIFGILDMSPKGKTCEGMKALLKEGSEMLKETEGGAVRDAAMISAAQRVEHYEMAGYGSVRTYAQLLGRENMVNLLEKTLEEEKKADSKLTSVSRNVNEEALRAA